MMFLLETNKSCFPTNRALSSLTKPLSHTIMKIKGHYDNHSKNWVKIVDIVAKVDNKPENAHRHPQLPNYLEYYKARKRYRLTKLDRCTTSSSVPMRFDKEDVGRQVYRVKNARKNDNEISRLFSRRAFTT